jgi:hypothetical protein
MPLHGEDHRMIYDPNRWNWQDTAVAVLCWVGLPCFVFGMKWRMERQWLKQFGERKPRALRAVLDASRGKDKDADN